MNNSRTEKRHCDSQKGRRFHLIYREKGGLCIKDHSCVGTTSAACRPLLERFNVYVHFTSFHTRCGVESLQEHYTSELYDVLSFAFARNLKYKQMERYI